MKNTGDKLGVPHKNSRITRNCSDDEIYQSSRILQPSNDTNSNVTGDGKQFIQFKGEESEEYR